MSTTTEDQANVAGKFGDTTYTKVFVGGLAWETQKETMKRYFEQFGEIIEAVVIIDKNSRRSKGYGFVTFKEAEAARRACVDPAPVIDGRRANCNLASLGVQRSTRPSTPQHGGRNRNHRIMHSFQAAGFQNGVGTTFASAPAFLQTHYAIQPGIPFKFYGYSPCSPDYTYPVGYYGLYGGTTSPNPIYGTGVTGHANTHFYPYSQFVQGFGGATPTYSGGQGFGYQIPQPYCQYSTASSALSGQHYGAPHSVYPSPAPASQAGTSVAVAIPVPALNAATPHANASSLQPITTI